MEHYFNVDIAREYGIEEAILLHHFYYWIAKNAVNGKHLYDGLYWTYNTKRAYSEFFPYMNETKISRVIKHLEEEGVIVKGNYNSDKWDKTNWYGITKRGLELLSAYGYNMMPFSPLLQNDSFDRVKMHDGVSQNEQSIIIKYTNNNIANNNNNKKEYKEKELFEQFSEFVSLYKRLTGKRTRSVKVEFDDFRKRHKDWYAIIPYLSIAIMRETRDREQAKQRRQFFPEPKMLQTYLGKQRAWELYVTIGEDVEQVKNTYTPQGRTIWFNESTKSYWTTDNFYYETISDGYDDDTRPDGATLTLNNARGDIKWNKKTKKWEKV